MWIDFKNHTVLPEEIIYLQLIKQNQKEDLKDEVEFYVKDRNLDIFLETGYVELIKAKNKADTRQNRARLTSKGRELLEELETPPALEDDVKVFEWLKSLYLKQGKEVGNGAKTLRHIASFRTKSNIEKNNLIKLCLAFLQDEENMEYNIKLEYAFYKAPTAFETKFQLEESRLYKYYLKRQQYFDSIFEQY